jgi:protein TonB
MFEDSTFASANRIPTHSRRWMVAAFTFNAALLLTLVLIPLIYPEALSRQPILTMIEVPVPPPPEPQTRPQPVQPASSSNPAPNPYLAPIRISDRIYIPTEPEPPRDNTIALLDPSPVPQGSGIGPLHTGPAITVVNPSIKGPMRVSSSVVAGLLILKTLPHYPPIGVAAHVEGTVQLAATISKTGTIENLRALNGPVMLRQAALDAVAGWRYRPYMLNGEPVEVETTVDVFFKLAR